MRLTTSRIDSRGTSYDYDSMMHYGAYYFTSNGGPTILTKNPADQNRIGQRKGFSEVDKKQINLMYCGGGMTFYHNHAFCTGATTPGNEKGQERSQIYFSNS